MQYTPTTPSLSGSTNLLVDKQGGTDGYDKYTSRGFLAFAPWVTPSYPKSVGQINNSYVAVSKADTLYSGSTVNNSRQQFQYHYTWFSESSTSYLATQYHLTANHSSAVTSVAAFSFIFNGDQTTMPQFSVAKSTQISSNNTPLTPTPTNLLGATVTTFNIPIIKAMF